MTLLVIIATLSGASALVFENLWFRSASIALGSSVASSAVVLSAFMAGLAIGTLGYLRFVSAVRRPLRVYAWIELSIAVSGLAVLVVLPRAAGWLAPTFSELGTSTFATNALRLSVSFGLLLIPASAMGATLPVLMHAMAGRSDQFGRKLGLVYGANTLGAVAGALATELTFVPALGVSATGLAAATLNCGAAAVAWRPGRTEARARPIARGTNVARRQGTSIRWSLVMASGLSGALFLAFEVATFRFLLLFFTALNVNFAVMLAVVLCGLGVGGFVGARWFQRKARFETAVVGASFVASAVLVVSYRLFPWSLAVALNQTSLAAVTAATAAFALPLSALSGFLFTAIGHALHQTGLRDTTATALLTAANTIGAAIGSLLTGFVLIERLGLERSFFAIAVGYGVVGLLIAGATARGEIVNVLRTEWKLAGVFVGGLVLFPSGVMNDVFHRFPINGLSAAGETRVAVKEGRLETLQYLRSDSLGQPDYYRLVTNNHSMAATDVRSRRYMRLFGYLPSILHPRPESAALLGVGLGVTATALTDDTRFRSIDVIDVSPDIPKMLSVVYGDVTNPLEDRRVRLHVEDGRFFLATTNRRFDVITAEPPPPHYAGVANLYSQEFFHLLADRLNAGGIATYWLPVHDLRQDEARAIVAAFLAAFPETSLWTGSGLEWILMGLKPPGGGVTDEAFRAWWARPPSAARLSEIGLDRAESLGALFLADGPRLRQWVGATPPLTDDFPRRISVDASRDAEDSAAFVAFMTASERLVNFVASPLIDNLWPDALRSASVSEFKRQTLVDVLLSLPVLDAADLLRILGERPAPLLIKALFWRHYFDFDRAHALLSAQPDLQESGVAEYRAQLALMNGNPAEAALWLSRSTSPRTRELQTIREYCLLISTNRALADEVRARAR